MRKWDRVKPKKKGCFPIRKAAFSYRGGGLARFPLPEAVWVTPTPQQLIGFSTHDEQLETQQFLLRAPIHKVKQFMETTMSQKVERGDVLYAKPKSPQPPSHGPTMWSAKV